MYECVTQKGFIRSTTCCVIINLMLVFFFHLSLSSANVVLFISLHRAYLKCKLAGCIIQNVYTVVCV